MLRLSSLSYRWHTEGDTLAWTPPEGSECPVQKPTDMRNSYNLTGHLSLVQYVVLTSRWSQLCAFSTACDLVIIYTSHFLQSKVK